MDEINKGNLLKNIKNCLNKVIIESIELLRRGREYLMHVRSKDGAEGICLTNSRAGYLHPILNQLVVPYFIGKDAREHRRQGCDDHDDGERRGDAPCSGSLHVNTQNSCCSWDIGHSLLYPDWYKSLTSVDRASILVMMRM